MALVIALSISSIATSMSSIDAKPNPNSTPAVEISVGVRDIVASAIPRPNKAANSGRNAAKRATGPQLPAGLGDTGGVLNYYASLRWLLISILVTNLILLILLVSEIVRERKLALARKLNSTSLEDRVSTLTEILRRLEPHLSACVATLKSKQDPPDKTAGGSESTVLPPLIVKERSEADGEASAREQLPTWTKITYPDTGRPVNGRSLVDEYCASGARRSDELIQGARELGLEVAAPGPYSNRGVLDSIGPDEVRLLAIQEQGDSSIYLVVLRDEVAPDLNFWSDLFEIPKEAKVGSVKVRCVMPARIDIKSSKVISRGEVVVVPAYRLSPSD